MKPIKNKEKIVKDLVSTFNDRDELHKAYKERMKAMLWDFMSDYLECRSDKKRSKMCLVDFIDEYVETRFKPSDE